VELDLVGLQMPDAPEQQNERQIVLRPLERGYGHTLGNTLRRILLSSLRGSAVWAFRTDNVLHEHQTIPDVVEDVHQVIKNLKALVLSMDDDTEEAVLELRTEGAGAVTARDIREHAHVRVINPDHHILELTGDREFKMELHVNKGRGFVLAEQHPIPRGMPADLVRIDAMYNPVRRANFVVEETRVGQRTDFDRLVLEVETNGAVEVLDAVQYAARVAIEHFGYLAGGRVQWSGERPWTQVGGPGADGEGGERELITADTRILLDMPIDQVEEISVRSSNSLKKAGINTVSDLVERSETEMLKIDNFGRKSLEEVAEFLEKHDLRFGMALEESDGGLMWWGASEGEEGDGDQVGPEGNGTGDETREETQG